MSNTMLLLYVEISVVEVIVYLVSYVDIVTTETTDKYKGIPKCSHAYLGQIKRMENETFFIQ